MDKQNKELLLKDLCARLPYGVMVQVTDEYSYKEPLEILAIDDNKGIAKLGDNVDDFYFTHVEKIENIKPYLRPMSSMTQEELNELEDVASLSLYDNEDGEVLNGRTITNGADVDWLNANHFDFRGLILMGLALKAPADMYNLNNYDYENSNNI